MVVLPRATSREDWERIVSYYVDLAPDTLPNPSRSEPPQLDPPLFISRAFADGLHSTGIITLLEIDSASRRIFVGEGGSNLLRVFDWNRRLLSSVTLESPPTDIVVDEDGVLLLESGILDPNDQPRGSLARYGFADGQLQKRQVLIDSLFRPVFAAPFDFDGDGRNEFVICEYGDNRGRLALYRFDGVAYRRQILDPQPGAIRVEIRDLTGDGAPDIVALLAQGDERIVLFENDGAGTFAARHRVLSRFPPVYGSMHFSMHDLTGDGQLDIVYVNGDNFDYSRVLKPYHGIRILENDGKNNFHERFFYPLHGAARAEVADFDQDGDSDLFVTANFPDRERHPERAIVFLENDGPWVFRPFAFTVASSNGWNLTAAGDFNRDGRPDVMVGAMDLEKIGQVQQRFSRPATNTPRPAILLFETSPVQRSSGSEH
jgi:hypothetical protein